MKASDLVVDSNISLLLKAPPGFSKTCAACSFAVEGPIFLAYWDKKGPLELDHFFRRIVKRPELLKNIEYEIYGAHNANEYLNKLISFSKDNRYFAIITDSVTSFTSGAVNWSLGFRDNRKSKDKDRIVPDFDEYKVETSLITQSLDISRTLSSHIIWTAHPLPGIKIEGSGNSIKVTKTNPIVTYGSKVAGIIPGQFSEIYIISAQNDLNAVGNAKKYIVSPSAIGDDFAKSNIGLTKDFDITNRLFYDVWKEQMSNLKQEGQNEVISDVTKVESFNPFGKVEEKKNPW